MGRASSCRCACVRVHACARLCVCAHVCACLCARTHVRVCLRASAFVNAFTLCALECVKCVSVRLCVQAPHLDCFDGRWETAQVYAILTLAIWGALTPLVLAIVLHFARNRLTTAEFSRKFSMLTFGYKRGCVWWEMLSMLKRFLVSGCIVLFREAAIVQSTLMLVTILAFLCFTVGVRPFYNRLISTLCILGEV